MLYEVITHRGIVVMLQVGGGSRAALSDQDFVRMHGRSQLYVPLGQRDTLTLRGEIGYTLAESRDRILRGIRVPRCAAYHPHTGNILVK